MPGENGKKSDAEKKYERVKRLREEMEERLARLVEEEQRKKNGK